MKISLRVLRVFLPRPVRSLSSTASSVYQVLLHLGELFRDEPKTHVDGAYGSCESAHER